MRLRRELHRLIRIVVSAALLVSLGGCVSTVVSAAVDVVTAPIRIVGAGIDTVAPGQHERDRRRGERERKAEKKERKAEKKERRDAEKAERKGQKSRDGPFIRVNLCNLICDIDGRFRLVTDVDLSP